ncbi:class Ib ribonucleoside-diphosphate reductase assembly flavoprotein NrdI [soil metagenome]
MADLVYFSSVSNNTHRFIERLGKPAHRIPVHAKRDNANRDNANRDGATGIDASAGGVRAESLRVDDPYVLVLPTYGGGSIGGAVPKQVISFLNDEHNRSLIRGVIASGNTNFGEAYGLAGDIVARKCNVNTLYRFEVFGTPDDLEAVASGLEEFWKAH